MAENECAVPFPITLHGCHWHVQASHPFGERKCTRFLCRFTKFLLDMSVDKDT